MKKLLVLILLSLVCSCSTYNVTVQPGAGCVNITIDGSKVVSTLPVKADGNTIPVSAIP